MEIYTDDKIQYHDQESNPKNMSVKDMKYKQSYYKTNLGFAWPRYK